MLFEITGFSQLDAPARAALDARLVRECLAAGYATAGSFDAGWFEVIRDRSSGWPDLRAEIDRDGRFLIAEIDQKHPEAWERVRGVMLSVPDLGVVALPSPE